MRGTHQHLVHGIKQEKAKTEMNDTVVMISIQVQPILHPKTSRNLRVAVMRADGVKSQKDENEHVGKIGELKFAISKCQHGHADEDQKIFEQPIAAIEGMDRQCDPERNVTDNRNGQKMLPGIACVRMSECVSLCVLPLPNPLLCPHCRSRVRLSQRERREQNGSEGEPPSVAATQRHLP